MSLLPQQGLRLSGGVKLLREEHLEQRLSSWGGGYASAEGFDVLVTSDRPSVYIGPAGLGESTDDETLQYLLPELLDETPYKNSSKE